MHRTMREILHMQYIDYPASAVRKFCEAVFIKRGFTEQESRDITDVILTSDLYGMESHGVQRMIRYHKSIDAGFVDPAAKPRILFQTPVSAVLDGTKTMGQLTAITAMRMAVSCPMVFVPSSTAETGVWNRILGLAAGSTKPASMDL